jgi:hypothetical protein
VALGGTDLETLFGYWDDRGTYLNEDNFLGGLADLAKARGYSEADVCRVFGLHRDRFECPDYALRRQWLGWVDATTSPVLAAFAAAPAPTALPTAVPELGAAFVTAIAALDATPPATPEPGSEPEPGAEPCAECAPPVVFRGVQKVQVPGLGKAERETGFAFRLGDGSFQGIDPTGHVFQGALDVRGSHGAKVRLHPAREETETLLRLLAASAEDLGADAASLRLAGPAKIELRLAKGGSLVGKIAIAFEVEVGGRVRRGSYVAKLRGAEA